MPPLTGHELRTGRSQGQSPLHHRTFRIGHSKGRSPSDYLHAVRADSPSCQRSTTGQPSPLHTHVLVRPTAFQSPELRESDARIEFQQIYQALTESVSRNAMICSDVISAVAAGRFPLVLTERTEHLTCLAQQLQRNIPHVI